jgi:hypothetical protein
MEPIFVRRSGGAAARLPELVRECGDFIVSECSDAMPGRGLVSVFESLPRTLVSGQVFLLPMLFADTMSVGGAVLQFGGELMVLVVRSVVIASGHVRSHSCTTVTNLSFGHSRA